MTTHHTKSATLESKISMKTLTFGFVGTNQPVFAEELRLADRVMRMANGEPDLELGIMTVKQIKDGAVHFFRPYTNTADFSCTSGVICYVGVEEFRVAADSSSEWFLLRRKELK